MGKTFLSHAIALEQVTTPEKIALCYPVFFELRPHLLNQKAFIKQVLLQQNEGYHLAAILEKEALAAIGFRIMTTLAWGKILYIDDLVTQQKCRGSGYATALLEYAMTHAQKLGCTQIHLDSGYHRQEAHRFYLNHRFQLSSHHLALEIKPLHQSG